MTAWILLAFLSTANKGASFQVEFKTSKECRSGALILSDLVKKSNHITNFDYVCMEIRK